MRVLNRVLFLPRKRIGLNTIKPDSKLRSTCLQTQTVNTSRNFFFFFRPFSSESKNEKKIVESTNREETAIQTTVIENIKETTKTASYLGVILIGLGIGISVFAAVFVELFSSKSPSKVYSKAFDYVAKDPRVQNVLGDQIKGFGEETRRGRRQHVSHVLYQKDGMNLMRMQFYVKGTRERGTVHLEMYENDQGKYEYRYLFVITDGLIRKTIILEDNRQLASATAQGSMFPSLETNLQELDLSSK